MSDNVKIIIEIPKVDYENIKQYYESHDIVETTYSYIYHGKPLSEVLRDIEQEIYDPKEKCTACEYLGCGIIEIIDKHIGKAESEGKPNETIS